jgi:hypothetical protein
VNCLETGVINWGWISDRTVGLASSRTKANRNLKAFLDIEDPINIYFLTKENICAIHYGAELRELVHQVRLEVAAAAQQLSGSFVVECAPIN